MFVVEMAWAMATKAHDMGRGGGAAYWDWALSRAGFTFQAAGNGAAGLEEMSK